MTFTQFLEKVCLPWNLSSDVILLKWLFPGSRCAPIILKSNSDLQNMLDFSKGSTTVDVFVSKDDASVVNDHHVARGSVSFVQSEQINDGYANENCDRGITCLNEAPRDRVLSVFWERAIEGVGQIFKSSTEFRQSVSQFAIANGFRYRIKQSDKKRVIIECAVEGCYWFVRASSVNHSGLFRIHKYQSVHQHPPGSQFNDRVTVLKSLIANTMVEKVRDTPKYPPTEIAIDMKRDYHLDLSYMQCWRAKEVANEKVFGSFNESYMYIPWYCDKVIETNPGSHATYEVDANDKFTRLFVAFYAALQGFKVGCRLVLYIDGTFLKSRYLGTLLSAIAMDADDGMFPVAFAIVSGENNPDWTWFLEHLHMALGNTERIVFISDRHQSIIEGVRSVFGDAHHGYCLRHLKENFKKNLRKPISTTIKNASEMLLNDAAYARTTAQFNNHMGDIRGVSEDAYAWLIATGPENWANFMFPGKRYDKLTSNYAETYNAWIVKSREFPIMQLLNNIRVKHMEMMYKRQEKVMKWKYVMGPRINKTLKKRARKSEGLIARRSSMHGFEVEGDINTHSVDLSMRVCSCKVWEMTGLPCIHACAEISRISEQLLSYVSHEYHKEVYAQFYAEPINPVPNHDMSLISPTGDAYPVVRPPRTHKRAGRPKRQRIESQDVEKRPRHYSRCGDHRHNRRSCREAI